MHPSKEILERFIIGLIANEGDKAGVRDHLEICELCRDYCERYGQFLNHIRESDSAGATESAHKTTALDIHRSSLRNKIIPLDTLEERADRTLLYSAADGQDESKIKNLATLYSENPDVVLRIMRDMVEGYDYAQVISDDPDMAANVMIQLPEMDREFIVDDSGRARIDGLEGHDIEKMRWQLKMPQAVFTVEPLSYDPERTEQSDDFILTTDRGDRLKVTVEQKTEGKQISVQILEIDGKTEFGDAQVNIVCKAQSMTGKASPTQTATFGPIDIADPIHIRVFI